MASPVIPQGFVLNEPQAPQGLPAGFVINEPRQAPAQPQGQGISDTLIGAANIANRAIAGIGEEAVAGLAGLLFAPSGQGAQAVEAARAAIPDVPLVAQGEQLIGDIVARFDALPQGAKDFISEFTDLGPKLGESTFQATGSPLLATAVGALPGILEAGTGIAGGKVAARGIGEAIDSTRPQVQAATDIFTRQSPAKQRISELISEGSTDIDTARFKLPEDIRQPQVSLTGEQISPRLERIVEDPSVPGGERLEIGPVSAAKAKKVVKDTAAINSIKQGFDEGVIADVKQASKSDKAAMRRMVDIAEESKRNKRFGVLNRPGDVVGDTLMDRLRVVQKANRDAGKQIDRVAESLTGKRVDVSGIGDRFIGQLNDMGVSVQAKPGGGANIDFAGSDIEDLAGPESVIKRVVKRMSSATPPDAKELHRLKRFIDEQVTFGKSAEGLAGKTERVLKELRRDINATLGDQFPEYREVNTQYSETIQTLDAFQDVAGRKMDLTGPNADKATGTLMRRLMSNAQSRVRLLDSINEIEAAAKKFGGKLTGQKPIEGAAPAADKNDLLSQVLFADELDAVFGPAARTSLQGQFDQALKQGVGAVTTPGGAEAAGVGLAGKVIERARRINEKGAFKAIKDLLKE